MAQLARQARVLGCCFLWGAVSAWGQLVFTGEIRAEAPDASRVQVTFGVESKGGDCAWSAWLTRSDGNEVDRTIGEVKLRPGRSWIPVAFDGRLARARVEGQLLLAGGLHLVCGDQELRVLKPTPVKGFTGGGVVAPGLSRTEPVAPDKGAGKPPTGGLNLIIVLDRTNPERCQAFRKAAQYLLTQLAEGRDAVGLISFGDSPAVHVLPRRQFRGPVKEALQQLPCEAAVADPPVALVAAGKAIEKIATNDRTNAVVLFLGQAPHALTADWPLKLQADTRFGCTGQPQECETPPTACPRAQSQPVRPGRFVFYGQQGFPASGGAPAELACSFEPDILTGRLPANGHRDLAFIPAADQVGVPFTGPLPLLPFEDGPYAEQIRPDIWTNARNAALNQMANYLEGMREDPRLQLRTLVISTGSAADQALYATAFGPQSVFAQSSQHLNEAAELAVYLLAKPPNESSPPQVTRSDP
jgi:hypothetical protein